MFNKKEWSKQYYEDNKDRLISQQREYQERNAEKIKADKYAYRHSIRGRANNNNRLARNRATNNPPLTPVEKEWMLFYYAEALTITEQTGVKHEIDHIVPLSKGGPHAPWNLQILTSIQNKNKGNS